MSDKHKVFISFHHDQDEYWRDEFVELMEGNIVDKSVGDGDIDEGLMTETIRQKIRDEFIADATVTVVLVGECTWQRKHVDWEIGSSLRDTVKNPRCGLLGILLPTHNSYSQETCGTHTIPPRLADNWSCGYASVCKWTKNEQFIQEQIHNAFLRRDEINPDNSRTQFRNNRSGSCSDGWVD